MVRIETALIFMVSVFPGQRISAGPPLVASSTLSAPIQAEMGTERPAVSAEGTGPAVYRGRPLRFYMQQLRNPGQKAETLRAIGNFGTQAASSLPELVEGLRDTDVEVRIAAAWALGQMGKSIHAPAAQALAQALSDPEPKVRSEAAVALRNAGEAARSAVPALMSALNDPMDYVRAPAADALGRVGPAGRIAVGALAQRLKVENEPPFVLRSVAAALGNMGPDARSALPALTQTLTSIRARSAAQEAIDKINGQSPATY
jgi:hypothetical protein